MGEIAIGQNHIYNHFKNAISAGKISHAYIINGEKGSGKMDMAKLAAKAMQCQNNNPSNAEKTGKPCGNCQSCKQTDSGNQPDIKYIQTTKNSLGVDDIRVYINDDVDIKPYGSPYKIYIVSGCEKMTVQAQNALLKTIEEPPKYAVFILLTTNADLFLPTILSRCVLLNTKTVKEAELIKTLQDKYDVSEYDAKVATVFAGGNAGKAAELIESEEFKEIRKSIADTVREVATGGMDVISGEIKKLSNFKNNKSGLEEYLDMFIAWFKDVLKYKATNNTNDIVFQDSMPMIKQLAEQNSFEDINEIITEIMNAKSRIKSNVGFESNLEVMLLGIKEKLQ